MTIRKRICSIVLSCVILLSLIAMPVPAGNLDPTSDAMAVSLEVAEEGAVLLENDGILPIKDVENTSVAVFGRSQYNLIKGGGGSGIVYTSVAYNFVEGMEEAGIQYDKELYKTYSDWCEANPQTGSKSNPEMPISGLDFEKFAERNDMAIIVFARNSSEGSDHSEVAGDWYLTEDEEALLAAVSKAFEDVVVILNTGTIIDVSWIDQYQVSAVLEAWQPGSYGAISVGKILTGEVTPSGKLMATWAYKYEDYPASKYGTYGLTSESIDGDRYVDPIYGEDIYVGYRYFETFDPDAVRYEFGYGLSYTSFDYSIIDTVINDQKINVTVEVENTGDYAGKDVMQLYFSAPQGKLGKAAYEMGAYAKTKLLQPGEKDTLVLTFDVVDMASYDDSGITGHENCYVLEAGAYDIYAGTSVKKIQKVGTYTASDLIVVEELEEVLAPTYAFDIIKPVATENGFTTETIPASLRSEGNKVEDKWDTDLPAIELTGVDKGIKLGHVAAGYYTMDEFLGQFSLAQLVQIYGGIYGVRQDNYHYFPESAFGAAGGIGHTLSHYGVPFTVLADGPAGLRLTMKEGDTGNTAFPIGTMQACTWNEELLYRVGVEIGKEAIYNQVSVWLAPAVNIHRDPFCGRNFEYFSEDPVLAGLGGGAVVRGVQSQNVAVSVKHYAANSQEKDRMGGDSIVTERALREVYLKSFEILVKTSDPWTIMTSYNKINGSFTATNYELVTTILRDEWGFSGTVMTDWQSGKDNGNASMIRAQNDLCMPSLTGRGDPTLPDGFTSTGATSSWMGVVHAGTVYCQYCGTEYGDYELYKINNLWIPADEPCVDANGNIVEGCERPYDEYEVPDLPEGYTHDDNYIYDADGNTIVGYNDWLCDRTGLITGYVNGEVSLGELQRSARNIFELLIKVGSYAEVTSDLTIAEQPETVEKNEVFTFKAVAHSNVLAIKLVNENGSNIGIIDYEIEEEGDLKIFTISTKIGSPGDRNIRLLTKDISNQWTDSGVSLNIQVTSIPVEIYSASFDVKTVQKNAPVQLSITTSKDVKSIHIHNEYGRAMGKVLISKSAVGDKIQWNYEMSIGTAGMGRIFDITATDIYGNTVTQSVSINVK